MTFQPDPCRQAVIAEARSWLGTPFRHQARLKGVGVDCAQLAIAVGEACGVARVDPVVWRRFSAYGRAPNPARMGEALALFLVRVAPSKARPGDLMWLAWRPDLPMHLALLAERDGRKTMIHALSDAGKVVEHGFTAEWPGRVVSWWRYPGLMAEARPGPVNGKMVNGEWKEGGT